MDKLLGMDYSDLVKNIISNKPVERIPQKLWSTIKDQWNKIQVDSTAAFTKYLNNAAKKHGYIKTLLYRSSPKYIYDFFECNTLYFERKKIDANDIENVLTISNYLIVEGTGGIGKSTLMKHFFLNELSNDGLIPVFVELKKLNGCNETLTDVIYSTIHNLGFNLDKKYLEYALEMGWLLLLLDGYDEIISEKKHDFHLQLNDMCDKYPENYYILSSRPEKEDFVSFDRFSVLQTTAFSKEQALSMIKKLEFDEELKRKFLVALDTELYEKHLSFASNPLLLTIMLLTFDSYASIPDKLHIFYDNAFETLFMKHDATKAGFKRQIKSGLSYDSFKKVFAKFCFNSYARGQYSFEREEIINILDRVKNKGDEFSVADYVEDLTDSVCVLYRDGRQFAFTHRSFQEYFAAVYLKELTDENLTRVALRLLEREPDRVMEDAVFNMLHDMIPERFESQIMLPICKKIDNICAAKTEDDTYLAYFKYYVGGVGIKEEDKNIEDGGEKHYSLYLIFGSSDYVCFMYHFSHKLFPMPPVRTDEALIKKIKDILQSDPDSRNHRSWSLDKIVGCDELFELLKKSWVGERIRGFCRCKSQLQSRIESYTLDIDELFFD